MILTITEFAKVYGVTKREIDYWTSIDLLHPVVKNNGYRDYGEQAEDEIKVILIATMLDYPGSLESKYDKLINLDDREWKAVLDKLSNKHNIFTRRYNVAYLEASSRFNGGG